MHFNVVESLACWHDSAAGSCGAQKAKIVEKVHKPLLGV